MELSLNNLEKIYQLLAEAQSDADETLKHFDLNEAVDPTPENRQLLNSLFEHTSGHLMEVSRIDSFFQGCDVVEINTLNSEQQVLLIKSQALCQSLKACSRKVLEWVVKIKGEFNEASCPVLPSQDSINENGENSETQTLETDSAVSSKIIQTYHETREILKEIHAELIFLDPENMANTSGRRLKVMEGKSLFLETEHEMNVFMDYCLFQYYKNKKNIVQRYYNSHSSLYAGKKLAVLTAFKNTRFSFLKVIRAVGEYGLIVNDLLRGKDLLMIDNGLSQLAKRKESYAILTHYVCLPGFSMTTGASTPILLSSEAGKEMQAVFNDLVLHHQKQQVLDEKHYKQCVTDLYKIAIHSDSLKAVASRELPMNYHQLNKKNLFIN